LSGKVRESGTVYIAEIEGRMNPDYVVSSLEQAGFNGKAVALPQAPASSDADILEELMQCLLEPEAVAGIIDSLGAVVSPAQEKPMGREAQMIWQVMRRSAYILSRGRGVDGPPANLFLINHIRDIIGGYGFTTPGGTGPDFLCTVRLHLRSREVDKAGVQIVSGKVYKLTYDAPLEKFELVVLPTVGVHPGLTAVNDCIEWGYAERKRTGVYLGKSPDDEDKKNMGHYKTLVRHAYEGKTDRLGEFLERSEQHVETWCAEYEASKQAPKPRKETKKKAG